MFRVKHIYLTLIDRIQALKSEIEAINLRDFPQSDSLQVINTLSDIIECIEVQAKMDLSEDPTSNLDTKQAYSHLANKYLSLLEQVHYIIGIIANGVKTSVPWALTRVVHEVLRRSKKTDALIIYSPIWTLNFGIHPHRLVNLYEDLGSVLNCTDKGKKIIQNKPRIIAISFSYLDRKSPLIYAVLAHEIGHLFSEEYRLNHEGLDNNWCNTNLDPVLEKLSYDDGLNFLEEFGYTRRRAIEEIGADLFATLCVGPAFVFSVFDVLSRTLTDDHPPSANSNYYPSNRLRLKLALQVLQTKWDFKSIDKGSFEEQDVLIKSLKTLSAITEEGSTTVNAGQTIEEILPNSSVRLAYQYVLQFDVPKMIKELESWIIQPFDYNGFFSNAKELVNRLDNNIPPNQNGVDSNTWADSITILNVTWLSELNSLIKTNWGEIDKEDNIYKLQLHDKLSLKAIELSEIQRAYKG